jgi:hypothetical protein
MDVKPTGTAGRENRTAEASGTKSPADQAAKLMRDVRDSGAGIVEDVKDQISSHASRQSANAADQIEQVADSAHRTADALKEGEQAWLADMVERGAAELESFAGALRGNDLQGLLSQVASFARRQPALFAGASIAAGFVLARMARLATEQAMGTGRETTASTGPMASETAAPDWQSRAETTYPGAMYHG